MRGRRWRGAGLVGAALLLAGLSALAASIFLADRQQGSLRGGERPVNEGVGDLTDIDAHNSPTLVQNPARPANLVVINRIDTQQFSCALHFSFDGGARWSTRSLPIPAGEEPKCFAPDAAFASDGTLYVSFVTLRGSGNVPHAAWTVSSRDGGRTLSKPRKALGRLAFQVRLTADPDHPRRLYLTWLQAAEVGLYRFTTLANPIRSARSDDGGATWRPSTRVSSAARARVVAPSAAVGPGGEIYVLYLDLGRDSLDYEAGHEGLGGPPYAGRFELVLGRSADGGATWEESVVERRIRPIERFLVFLPAFPSLAIDPRNGRIYAGFHDRRYGDADVLVWSLASGAQRWQGPSRVNDTPLRDGTSQYLPRLAVAPDGRLDVVYYDRRTDPTNVMNEVSLQSSFDAGKSFTPRVRLSGRRFDARIGFGSGRGMPDLGSRLGLLSERSRAVAVWTDTRSGTVASNKQDLYTAEVTFSTSSRLEQGARYGGAVLALVGLGLLAAAGWRGRPLSRASD